MIRISTSLCCILLGIPALAQARLEWREVKSTIKPLARERHDMAYDAKRGQTILFGGKNGSAYYDDTWAYDASGWRRLSPTRSPEPRAYHTMAYDPVRERVVLIGGTDGNDFDDTWEWDGTNWTRVATGIRNISAGGASCYDPLQRGVFYNLESVNMLWNGKAWTSVLVQTAYGGKAHRMVYDAATGGPLLLYGSYPKSFHQTVGWKDHRYVRNFDLRSYAMAVDPVKRRVVIQGGDGTVGSSTGTTNAFTWLWTGTHWAETAATNWLGRSRHAMTFDLKRGVFVIFGGLVANRSLRNETWELVEIGPRASYRTFGKGCSGSSKYLPVLGPDPVLNSAPVIGGAFTLLNEGLPPAQLVLLSFGASNNTWGGLSLPFSLAPLGMTGCDLLVSLDILVTGARSNGAGRVWWTMPIPDDPKLLGIVFYNQSAVVAPGANPGGLLWSNGGEGTIGVR